MNDEAKNEIKTLLMSHVETLAKETVDVFFKALEVIVKDSENKVDDMILPALPFLKEKLLELVDKIS